MPNFDIIVSPGTLYYAPIGEAFPSQNTVNYGAAWGGNWVNLGKTLAPVAINFQKEKFSLEVEQDIMLIRQVVTKFAAGFKTSLAEWTGANLALALDATKVTTAPGVSIKGVDVLSIDGTKVDVNNYAFGIEGFRTAATNVKQPVRVFFKTASISINGDVTLAKNAGAGLPIEVVCLADSSGIPIVIHNVTAPGT